MKSDNIFNFFKQKNDFEDLGPRICKILNGLFED